MTEQVEGVADQRFAQVRERFAEIAAAQPGTGAALAVCVDGSRVVDLWGGYADVARSRAWQRDSIAMPYSVTKPFAAICVLLLVQRGRIDLDSEVAAYWPEFATVTTVRHVLAHQSGHVALTQPVATEAFYDWGRVCDLLAVQEPAWPPGRQHGESALFYGHLLGELVRQVDGRDLGSFLADEVCNPLGIDFHIGLRDQELARVVDLTGLTEQWRIAGAADRPPLYERAMCNPPGALSAGVVNTSSWRRAQIPAINGHGSARGVSDFYAALVRGAILAPELLAEATRGQRTAQDRVLGGKRTWGLGFAVEDDGYGMGGLGGSLGWHSTDGGYSVGFVTGSVGDDRRADDLERVLRECLGLPPQEV